MNDVKGQVRQYLTDNMLMADSAGAIGDDDSFLAHNLLDSTGVLELVDFLESRFEVLIEDREILPENLDSLARIAAFIDRKRGGQVQAA